MRELPSALAPLGAFKQFIIYKAVPSESRPGKTDKLPIDPKTGRVVSAHDPSVWMDAKKAISLAQEKGEPYGVGFVFTENDPFWVVDIDGCLTETGWAPHALQVCRLLSGAAVEISRSGKGVHVIGSGRLPLHACKNEVLDMELYHSGRFIALTGINTSGSASTDLTLVLASFVSTYFTPDSSSGIMGHWSNEWPAWCAVGPDPAWKGPTDDLDLIRRALKSKSAASAFGTKVSFADLWMCDEAKLAAAFPDSEKNPWDQSRADSSLAQHLAFWTGKDCLRIERLMWQSKLVREKWGRLDYLPRTILGVVARQVDVMQSADLPEVPESLIQPTDAPVSPTEGPKLIEDTRIVNEEQQTSIFAGCVYITDSHRILSPGGHILKPDQFRVHYGGYNYVMDRINGRMTRDAWEAFTQSQLLSHPKVNGACFRPDLPNSQIVIKNGLSFVNTYTQVPVPRQQGDPMPFLNHVARLLPNQYDQLIIMSYMAACVQYKGVKFRWAPLLQGVEGNGKTLLTHCLAEAIGRRYVHWPKASKLAKEFNAWMVGKILYAVEDIYVPDARREVIEELKPMITGDQLEIEAKGVDQVNADICGNFLFNSNHRDAIAKTRNDRRFCVLFTAQQGVEDLTRDEMTGDYFPAFYNWLKFQGGYAIVSEFLYTFSIPAELNPAGDCQRAPISSTTGEAILASTGAIEQEILEAVSQEIPGFCGGWVSSTALDKLLEKMNLLRKINHFRRKEILESLGYHWHPALKEGRTDNKVLPDDAKPRLYIHDSSMKKDLKDKGLVAREYEKDNNLTTRALPFRGHLETFKPLR